MPGKNRNDRTALEGPVPDPGPLAALAGQVRARRKSLRLTQEGLAELALCSSRFVRALEAGKATVRLDKLIAVLDALGLELTAHVRRTD